MTYANIILKKHDRYGVGEAQSIIDPFMKPLIEKLALTYPQWNFEECNMTLNSADKTYHAYRFNIVDKREVLGTIDKEWGRSGYRFKVDNHRINAMRQRGSGMKTVHMDKAFKYVGKFFSKKNIIEKVREASQVATSALENVRGSKNYAVRSAWNNDVVTTAMQNYLVSNFPNVLTMLDAHARQKLEDFPRLMEEQRAVFEISSATHSGNSYLVLLDGMDYAIKKGNDAPTIKTSEQLPSFMRQAIGMLKLVEDGQVIEGIGFRTSETTFIVVDKEAV